MTSRGETMCTSSAPSSPDTTDAAGTMAVEAYSIGAPPVRYPSRRTVKIGMVKPGGRRMLMPPEGGRGLATTRVSRSGERALREVGGSGVRV